LSSLERVEILTIENKILNFEVFGYRPVQYSVFCVQYSSSGTLSGNKKARSGEQAF